MQDKFKVGDMVYGEKVYCGQKFYRYGEIVKIDKKTAWVKALCRGSYEFYTFNLSELTKAKDKEFPKLQLHDFIEVGGNKEMRFFLTDEYEQFDGIVHPDEDCEFAEEDVSEVWRQVDKDTFKCIYRKSEVKTE